MANQNSKNKTSKKNTNEKKSVNTKKQSTTKNTAKKQNTNKKKEVKKVEPVVTVKEEVKVKEVTPNVQEKVVKVVKEKKSFSLTSKQKDLILILLVVVLLIVAVFVTTRKEPKLDIELPVALEGEAGFTEITYSEYEDKMNSEEPFLVVVVRDGCGYCEMYEPILKEVAEEYKLPIYYINMTNLNNEEYTALGTSNSYFKKNQGNWGTPTTLFMKGSTVIDSIPGYVDKDKLVNDFVKENFKVEG